MTLRRACLSVVAILIAACTLRAEDWPQFRGPTGQGISGERGLPLTWSEEENIAWRTEIPGRGWSSPVVASGQVWITSAIEEEGSLRAIAIDCATGKTLHDIEVFQKPDLGRINAKNTHASPTPVIDGDRVFVHFGSLGTACLSTAGEIIWRTELAYNQHHGPGASPIVWNGLLIVSCDGVDKQYVIALDKETGKPVWQRPRAGKNAYATPLVIEPPSGQQLIAAGGDGIWSYDPASGRELWQFRFEGHSVIPRPVYSNGRLFACSGYWTPSLYALRVDGSGDVTSTHQLFSLRRGIPFTPSPLLVNDLLLLVSDRGIATVVEAQTGREYGTSRLGGNFSASPVLADGKIYLSSEDGLTLVLAAEGDFDILAENQLPGQILASPAIADGAIYLRTDEALYCIRETRASAAEAARPTARR